MDIADIISRVRQDVEMGADPAPIIGGLLSIIELRGTPPFDRFLLGALLREIAAEPTFPCPRGEHGEQEVTSMGSGSGFAGGQIYWTVYACGCVDMDESNDIAAAY